MAIQDDWTVDVVGRRLVYIGGFTDDRPNSIYTMLEFYSWLEDLFDEPGYMIYPVPMNAQTPTQFTMINNWFIDELSIQALYGGSLQTSGYLKATYDGLVNGVTQVRWEDASADPPADGDIGVTLTGGTSGATGRLLDVDTVRQVAWIRNTSAAQFASNENITGTGVDLDTEVNVGVLSGETEWANAFSVGSVQTGTEIYLGQEDDYMGGRAFHDGSDGGIEQLDRRIEKIDEWWDSDVDFTGSPNLLGGVGHFDVLVKTREAGRLIDGGRLAGFARQFSKIYSHFEFVGGVGNFVVVFTSTGADINSQFGPYSVDFDANSGTITVGDLIENDTGTTPVGRLRAVITGGSNLDQAAGTIEYYLIGENEPLTTTDRTLRQFVNNDNARTRGGSPTFDIAGAPAQVSGGPADDQGVTVTFGNAQADVNEDTTQEEYACTINCNDVPLAEVWRYLMFLGCRGNQDGTTPDTQDTLLPSAATPDEASEFYRAVGDITVPWDNKTGTPPAEGSLVTNGNGTWTASGVVVALSNPGGASGQLTLTQVKGTWANDDTVAVEGQHGTNEVTVNGTPNFIVDNTGAPFGSFAGGRWFVARGILLTNVPASDANNWETIDLAGSGGTGARIVPPAVRAIVLAGTVAGDRGIIAEVDTAGATDITVDQNTVGADASVGDNTLTLGSTVELDAPAADNWCWVSDVSSTTGQTYRFWYTSVSGTTVTFDTGGNLSGTATSVGTSTVLNDTGAFTNFGTANGELRIGMIIRNTTDSSWAVVVRKIDNDSIETTPLQGGGDNTWDSADTWEANTVPVALEDASPGPADTVFFPFVEGVATGSSIGNTIKFVETTECIARLRFSSPDIGGTRIQPFVLKGVQVQDADLTVTAIRNVDQIAA